MSITDTDVKSVTDGDGSTTTFAIPFDYFSLDEVVVYLRDNSVTPATETLQVLNTGYTIVGTDVEMTTAPTDNSGGVGEELIIIRSNEFTQTTSYAVADGFPPESHEEALDKMTRLIQENAEKIARSVITSRGSGVTDLELPTFEADKILAFNSTADGLELVSKVTAGVTDGDVSGPASTSDNALARFDGTTGKIIQSSSILSSTGNNLSGIGLLSTNGINIASSPNMSSFLDEDDMASNGANAAVSQQSLVAYIAAKRLLQVATKTTAYVITSDDDFIEVDATSGVFNLTLPLAGSNDGKQFIIQRTDSAGGNCLVNLSGSDIYAGYSTCTLTNQHDQIILLAVAADNAYYVIQDTGIVMA